MGCDWCGSERHATFECPHQVGSKECARCGDTEHATKDCPHHIGSTECGRCGNTGHATRDCPHHIGHEECARCGDTRHATRDCPHQIGSTECARCGNKSHATRDCPHQIGSTECARCGNKSHATRDCPQSIAYSGKSEDRDNDDDDDDSDSSSYSSSSGGGGSGGGGGGLVGIALCVTMLYQVCSGNIFKGNQTKQTSHKHHYSQQIRGDSGLTELVISLKTARKIDRNKDTNLSTEESIRYCPPVREWVNRTQHTFQYLIARDEPYSKKPAESCSQIIKRIEKGEKYQR